MHLPPNEVAQLFDFSMPLFHIKRDRLSRTMVGRGGSGSFGYITIGITIDSVTVWRVCKGRGCVKFIIWYCSDSHSVATKD